MPDPIHFLNLRDHGYAVATVAALTPGEGFFHILPRITSYKHYIDSDGEMQDDLMLPATITSEFSYRFFVTADPTEMAEKKPHTGYTDPNQIFMYENANKDALNTMHYADVGFIEAGEGSYNNSNFIVLAKDLEGVDVDWTLPKPYTGSSIDSYNR